MRRGCGLSAHHTKGTEKAELVTRWTLGRNIGEGNTQLWEWDLPKEGCWLLSPDCT